MRRASVFLSLLTGCSLSLEMSNRCEQSKDCNAGRVCVDSECVEPKQACVVPACTLFAITPALAAAGSSIELHGIFGPELEVHFPGGSVVAPSSLSLHDALVTVPEEAESGELTVLSSGHSLGSLPFRRLRYTPTITDALAEPTVVARSRPTLSAARTRLSIVRTEQSAFAIGGEDAAHTPLTTIERAILHGDGTLSPFSTYDGSALREARSGAAALVAGPWVYVAGGVGIDGQPLASIERAQLSSEGELGAFETVGELRSARSDAGAALAGNVLFFAGGLSASGEALASVESFRVAADGRLQRTADEVPTLVQPRAAAAAVVAGDTLWILGGFDSEGAALDSAERATLRAGDMSPFSLDATAITARGRANALATSQHIYLFGGEATGTQVAAIERADVASSLDFEVIGKLSHPRSGAGAFVHENSVQLVGGSGEAGVLASVEHLTLDSQAVIGAFAEQQPSLARSHEGPAVVIGRWLYFIGGKTNSDETDEIQRARIQQGGGIDSFERYGVLGAKRARHSLAAIGSFLYVLGGTTGDEFVEPIERAEILANGDLGKFSDSGIRLVTPRHSVQLAVIGDALHVFGGCAANEQPLRSIEHARIRADGTLEPFELQGELAIARFGAAPLLMGDSVYLAGGETAKDVGSRSVEQVELIESPAKIQTKQLRAQLVVEQIKPGSLIVGNRWYVLGGFSNAAAKPLTTVEHATLPLGESDDVFQNDIGLSKPRHYPATLVLGEWAYVMGGQAGRMLLDTIERAPLIAAEDNQ